MSVEENKALIYCVYDLLNQKSLTLISLLSTPIVYSTTTMVILTESKPSRLILIGTQPFRIFTTPLKRWWLKETEFALE
jgi:hypothetical protein